MKCKEICDLNTEITPDTPEVKELLLRLVDHHNNKPLTAYITKAKTLGTAQVLNNMYANDTNDAFETEAFNADNSSGTIRGAYDSSDTQVQGLGTISPGGLSFGSQVDADNTVRDQLYQAQGPSMVDETYQKQIRQEHKRAQTQFSKPNNKLTPIDPLSKEEQEQMRAQLQAKINRSVPFVMLKRLRPASMRVSCAKILLRPSAPMIAIATHRQWLILVRSMKTPPNIKPNALLSLLMGR